MEDKKLTPQESMALISDMIATTRRRLSVKDSNVLLLWGGMLVLISAAIAILQCTPLHTAKWNLLWLLLIPVGIYNSYMRRKYSVKEPSTYTDKVSAGIWRGVWWIGLLTVGVCTVFQLTVGNNVVWMAMYFYAFVIIGMAAMAQGMVIRELSLQIGGIFGVIMGAVMFCYFISGIAVSSVEGYLLVSLTYLVMFVIPGFVLRSKAKKQIR